MQRLDFPGIESPVLADFCELFAWASVERPSPVAQISPALRPAAEAIARAAGLSFARAAGADIGQAEGAALDPAKAVVLFSGGKDSLAAALRLREQGQRVALLYCRGINGAAYGREEDSAKEVARLAGFPVRVVEAVRAGKSAHIENPAKNLLLAALGASFAIRHGIGTVALGALAHDGENAKNFRCGLSDDPGLIELGAEAIRAHAPGLRVLPALHESDADSISTVFRIAPEVIPAIGSCMLGPRAHRMTREANERKFGLRLMPGRCGSCYKCAFELVALACLRGEILAPELARHCLDKLRAGLKVIRGQEKAPSAAEALGAFFEPPVAALDWRRALGLPADYSAA